MLKNTAEPNVTNSSKPDAHCFSENKKQFNIKNMLEITVLVLTFLLLLTFVLRTCGFTAAIDQLREYTIPIIVALTAIIMAFTQVIGIKQGQKSPLFIACQILMLASFLWCVPRLITESIHMWADTFTLSVSYATCFLMDYFICMPLAAAVSENRMKTFLKGFVVAYTAVMTVFSLIALYCALTGSVAYNLDHTQIAGISREYKRLFVFEYSTISAGWLALAVAMALLAQGLFEKNISVRILMWLQIAVYCCAISLTGTRTAYLQVGFVIGLALAVFICRRIGKHSQRKLVTFLKILLAIVIVLSLTVFSYFGMNMLLDALNELQQSNLASYLVLPAANAEWGNITGEIRLSTALSATKRILQKNNLFSGREKVWEAVIESFKNDPPSLITGISPIESMATIMCYVKNTRTMFAHTHNGILQMLVEYGLLGTLPYILVLIAAFVCSIRLLMSKSAPLWQKLLPAVPAVLIIGDMMEPFTTIGRWNIQEPVLALFIGLVLWFGSKKHVRKQPAAENKAE